MAFLTVSKQLQVHYRYPLHWKRANPDLHVARKIKTACNHICETHSCVNESVLNLTCILSGYETFEMTSVNEVYDRQHPTFSSFLQQLFCYTSPCYTSTTVLEDSVIKLIMVSFFLLVFPVCFPLQS